MPSLKTYLLALSVILGSISVVSAATPEFTWDCTNSLATCNNYCYAAACRRLFSGTSKFTYDSNANNAEDRRKASGCDKYSYSICNPTKGVKPYNKFGNSCDEFPFASTTQGGKDATLRCVDSTENSSEGGQLSAFYKKLSTGNKYTIFIKNYGGAKYCATKPSCTNDGGEFKLSQGNFINARHGGSVVARNSSDFDPVDPHPDGPMPLRTFVADDGSTHMMLTDNREDLVAQGTQLYSGFDDSTVTIVGEL